MGSRLEQLLRSAERDVLDSFFSAFQDAEEARDREWHAAIVMQSVWRMYVVKRRLRIENDAARTIQRAWKAFITRRERAIEANRHECQRRMQFFNEAATKIQKVWRGYASRKLREDALVDSDGFVYNYYARKRVLLQLALKNQEMAARLQDQHAKTLEMEEEERKKKDAEKLDKQAARMHHLLGTETTPGVFTTGFISPTRSLPLASPARSRFSSDFAVVDALSEEHIKKASVSMRKESETVKRNDCLFPPILDSNVTTNTTEQSRTPTPMGILLTSFSLPTLA
eukprot:TRINITY_DN1954_c0_g1_i1.p1 TRINITY_DN1954_c0_g1~~TRINITY_DN1954_c0_g1_i1.p1  ORF type:complete len:284 (-),score=67.94 TRINITY_DN1954_c0_g1_i1:498-1349(-)